MDKKGDVMKPICYLDVDDTLIMFPLRYPVGYRIRTAPGTWELIKFLNKHYEVRWLTCWCPSGIMSRKRAERLADYFENDDVDVDLLCSFANPKRFMNDKTDAIDFSREFIWIEDGLLPVEQTVLRQLNRLKCWIPCDVSRNPNRVKEVLALLKKRVK